MRTRLSSRARWLALTATIVTPVIALTCAPSAAFAAPSDAPLASGEDWSVTRAPGGYLVTVDLDEPLPIVSDAPTLVADGETLGFATESADGLSLSLFTTDATVTRAADIDKGWASADIDKAAEQPAPERVDEPTNDELVEQMSRMAPLAATADPADPGTYAVTEAEYDFGDRAVPLAGISGIRGEMTGKMYLTDAPGERPTVILLHGRHTSCSTGTANPLRWPCGPNQVNVRSYQGYEGTGRALASHGYNVLSIAANAVNSNDNQLALDYGAQARGQLILDTLGMLEKANSGAAVVFDDVSWPAEDGTVTRTSRTLDEALSYATTRRDAPAAAGGVSAASLAGRFDLDTVGIMGHSRGGEGATSAVTLNQGLADPYGIVSVLPLAPVDFGRMTVPDVPMAVFLPYCDGDVSNQQGQHMVDDSRGAFGDNVMRSAVWVMGANHNFFNTVWTPGMYPYATGDDWSTSDRTSSCRTADPSRLTASQQYRVGVSYMTGFFRLTMGGESQFRSLFDGSATPSTTATSYADVRIMASQPSSATTMLTDFTRSSTLVRTAGNASAQVCANAETASSIAPSVPYCTPRTVGTARVPHWTPVRFGLNVPAYPVTRVTWTGSTTNPAAVSNGQLLVTVPEGSRNVSSHTQLTLKAAPDLSVASGTDFTITVADGSGRTFTRTASEINPFAVNRLPGGTHTSLNKIVLQQLTIPTAEMTDIDLTDVREVRIGASVGADATGAGGLYLSDLAFDTPTSTPAKVATRTTVNVAGTVVEEGKAADTREIAVYLNRAESSTVTAWVSFVPTSGPVSAAVQGVRFAPGETCTVVEVPIAGNILPSTTPSTAITVSATNTTGAVMGASAFNTLTVREDDGVTGSLPALPEAGVQGDACAEFEASRTAGALTASATELAPGAELTLTATGYRVGESVQFTFAGTEAATATAAADGTASATFTIADDQPLGSQTARAIGAGSARLQEATVDVLTPTTTTLSLAEGTSLVEGAELTFIAKIDGAATEGTVTFTDGGAAGGGAGSTAPTAAAGALLGSVEVVDGVARLTLPDGLSAGSHAVVAVFGRTAIAAESRSEPLTFTLAAAPVTEEPGTGGEPSTPGTGGEPSTPGTGGEQPITGAPAAAPADRGDLALTGGEIASWALLAGGSLLALGAALLVARRRAGARADS
ncbi:LPXTG cell wall anchor domain-containing protein [Microbacterium binotii]|uniref:LPXTG cell wall anchor domain-containing protein n=1 Tax=Microbacterium binotii TaxID=462710 RepID=UPI001F1A3E17|nr:LPXTG cell wall anchor domain-containing protein [Microbacterium binotii]UIN30130.1 LPXTG cell wall anchor domain-containing protein [Microbacterium binotii]